MQAGGRHTLGLESVCEWPDDDGFSETHKQENGESGVESRKHNTRTQRAGGPARTARP